MTKRPAGTALLPGETRAGPTAIDDRQACRINIVPNPPPQPTNDVAARLMLVALSLSWGLSWPAMKISLNEIPPFSFRIGTTGLACVVLFAIAIAQRRNVRIKRPIARLHLAVAGVLNVGIFTLGAAFAQLATTTSRVAVLTYTMPIWAALLARPVLGERLNMTRGISLLLCAVGLSVLVYPLIGSSDLIGVAIALTTAATWAVGTVYLKWARVDADPLAIAAWQLVAALVVTVAGLFAVEGSLHLWPVHAPALLAMIFSAVFGSALAYILWFEIVRRLPATTATLGVLSAPVVGAVSSMLVLGERPTVPDLIGFTLVLGAAACVVLAPTSVVTHQ
jgi:drug/metabolite transporter (DMT)-like permease